MSIYLAFVLISIFSGLFSICLFILLNSSPFINFDSIFKFPDSNNNLSFCFIFILFWSTNISYSSLLLLKTNFFSFISTSILTWCVILSFSLSILINLSYLSSLDFVSFPPINIEILFLQLLWSFKYSPSNIYLQW